MTNASSIASHGRTGKASGMSVGSFGRLYRSISAVVPPAVKLFIAEVMNLVSEIDTVLNLESRFE